MKMGDRFLRSVTSLSGVLFLAGCSIGPRTPLAPESADETSVRPPGDDEKEEDFRLPPAESVGDSSPGGKSSAARDDSPENGFTLVGLAQIALGPRPPWTNLEQLPASAPPPKVPARWTLQKSIWVGQGYLYHADFTPGGQSVVTLSNQSGVIYHYDISGKLIAEIALPEYREFDDAAFIPMIELNDPPQLFLTRPQQTSVVDLSSGKIEALVDTPPGTDIAHSGRPGLYGVSYRSTNPQSGLLVLQWLSGEIALRAACAHRPDAWALSPDGKYLAISYYPADHVEVIDLQNKTLVSTLTLPKWGGAIDISPDGRFIALGGEKLVVTTFPDGEVLAEDTKYGNNINSVRFTPQGDLLLTSAYDGKARSYLLPPDLAETKKLPAPQLLAHSGIANVYALGLTPDGRMLVTSSGDKTIKIWKR
jgi:WD40 repeat protein